GAVAADVRHVELLGHLEVKLYGPALPGASDAVLKVEVYLGTVKGSVAGIKLVGGTCLFKRFLQPLLRDIPKLGISHRVLRPCRKLYEVLEAEDILIDIPVKLHDGLYLIL